MHTLGLLRKKAPLVGAFFVIGLWWLPVAAENCAPPHDTRLVQVRHVHDGDTLTLADDTRVRLIGINAPEVAGKNQPNQPLAIRARDRLRILLFEQGNRVQVLDGEQARDKHGRILAYLWLPDGTDVATQLLRDGLGWLVVIPPDTRFVDCRSAAEAQARAAQRGVWQAGVYPAKPSASLALRSGGFQRVRGRITRVNHGGGATWINLEGNTAIRIPDKDLDEFSQPPSTGWIGRELEVRGWFYQTRGQLRVTIGHPANLQLF